MSAENTVPAVPTLAIFTTLLNDLKNEIVRATGKTLKGEQIDNSRPRFRHFKLTADIKEKIGTVVTLWETDPQGAIEVLVEVTRHFKNKQVAFLKASTLPGIRLAIDNLRNVSEDTVSDVKQIAWELEQYVTGENFELDTASSLYWELVERLEVAQDEEANNLQAQSRELISQFAGLLS